ncbi:uncharacterized protein LTR77_008665 [Saxophila tyrrhenica]|uniref:Uncharacterized protein n=1 Tax=Saxophila tyrrhenica TaxID=1690608 RepID=A0AAV9P0A5_9PEZI|nr:hypothetical protein LTR77_008665 [Saxophila tyrrhenica]
MSIKVTTNITTTFSDIPCTVEVSLGPMQAALQQKMDEAVQRAVAEPKKSKIVFPDCDGIDLVLCDTWHGEKVKVFAPCACELREVVMQYSNVILAKDVSRTQLLPDRFVARRKGLDVDIYKTITQLGFRNGDVLKVYDATKSE